MDGTKSEAVVERAPAEAVPSSWWFPLSVAVVSLVGLVLVYFGTFRSMVAIWGRSDTYAHGYFVLPISLYLIWTLRAEVRKLSPAPDFKALVPLVVVGIGWLAARLAGVLVAEQYLAVATIPLLIWAVLGGEVTRRLSFPLGYLLLAVPVGEALIPYLIDYTAAFTVAALRLSGVPVYQQGNFLTLPNSQWSVVEACSGLRYLIACITIGLLFAYLTYRSWARRAAFIALSVGVPIVANWIRAYMIVGLGYASDMRIAVGIDHLIYGWIFYAFVMCLLFWVGSLFRDSAGNEVEAEARPIEPARTVPAFRTVLVAGAALLLASFWPLWARFAESRPSAAHAAVSFPFPASAGRWAHRDGSHDWKPYYVGASFEGSGTYRNQDSWVGLHVAYYRDEDEKSELVSSSNVLVGPDEYVWHQVSRSRRDVQLGDDTVTVEEGVLDATREDLVAWRWYWIEGRRTTSGVWAKLLEARGKLLLRETPSAGIVVFTEARPDEDAARRRLTDFLEASLPEIESRLESMAR